MIKSVYQSISSITSRLDGSLCRHCSVLSSRSHVYQPQIMLSARWRHAWRHLYSWRHHCRQRYWHVRCIDAYTDEALIFTLKIAPSHTEDLDPLLIHGSLDPPESPTQTAFRSVEPFLQVDRPRYPVGNNRPYLRMYSTTMWPKIHKERKKEVTLINLTITHKIAQFTVIFFSVHLHSFHHRDGTVFVC